MCLTTSEAGLVPADIEADDFVAIGLRMGNQYSADIAAVAVNQDPYDFLSPSAERS
jgi:hypothetical protein